ncbi:MULTISPECIES: pentapeptide repeat-containing protein [unclassified Crossiella]|uniref:pentapeptide repeat-containing protein n=1 Tax=unclassified Crossiella TaxID=2620835 RepID=UPI0020002504|nr:MULTISPECIES: pentapeptide repeat-containing protein [unclassified Crossiella]MCK2243953.1 pentapeptide repeat-containing protein [Crossiella sp. S99.2]MCK2257189.1 pentapeptide repeat-containing protein [Crossiella sp. S99.1]
MTAPRVPLTPLPWWWVAVSAAVVVLAGLGIGSWLWRAAGGLPEPEATKAQIEAIRTGLTTSAGVGAALALLLAVRRQRATEIGLGLQNTDLVQKEQVAADVRHDAAEKRITELYTKAADQLGSDKAPVRLAGLYALERLGEGNPDHRQTVVNLFCAYLRMPYESGEEERQVRLTAQRILAWHLLRATAQFWPDITLDLSGAVLLDFTLSQCVVDIVHFRDTEFRGVADFSGTEVPLFSDFSGAKFTGRAEFGDVTLARALFDEARFLGPVHFDYAKFPAVASFLGAVFTVPALFDAPVPGQVDLNLARARVGTDEHWPEGWIVQPPPREVEGRIEGLPGTWGYLTRNPDRHTE